jgi:uncharacterized protein (DUF885 family)
VRVRVDVGLHTEQMTFDEAVDYFTEHYAFYPQACASSEPTAQAVCAVAQREIYRYSKWPTQAITYNLGKQAIIDLRTTCQAQLGAQYSDQAFYNKLLTQGTIAPGFYQESFLAAHCQ